MRYLTGFTNLIKLWYRHNIKNIAFLSFLNVAFIYALRICEQKNQRIFHHQGASNKNCSTIFVTVVMFAALYSYPVSSTMAGLSKAESCSRKLLGIEFENISLFSSDATVDVGVPSPCTASSYPISVKAFRWRTRPDHVTRNALAARN